MEFPIGKNHRISVHMRKKFFVARLYARGYMIICVRLWGRSANDAWFWRDERKRLNGDWKPISLRS